MVNPGNGPEDPQKPAAEDHQTPDEGTAAGEGSQDASEFEQSSTDDNEDDFNSNQDSGEQEVGEQGQDDCPPPSGRQDPLPTAGFNNLLT